MKTVKILLFASALFMLTAESCAQKKVVEGTTASQIDSLSYALGINLANSFKQSHLDVVDAKVMASAMQDVFNGKTTRFDNAKAEAVIQAFMMERRDYYTKKNLEDGKKYLENNKKNAEVVELPSGLQYKIITQGSGIKPAPEDTVKVNYRGTTIDGTEFDASEKHGDGSVSFPLNGVIRGWTEGFQQFSEGTKAILYIPSEMAYGERPPYGSNIEPNSTLIFEIELLKVTKAAEQAPVVAPKKK